MQHLTNGDLYSARITLANGKQKFDTVEAQSEKEARGIIRAAIGKRILRIELHQVPPNGDEASELAYWNSQP